MPTLLRPAQQINIHGGETWKALAKQRYGADLQGMGADIEYAPQQIRGVDTLMKVGSSPDGLGWAGEEAWDSLNSPLAKRIAALLMLAHGYKRTGSLFWAAVWTAFGYAIPPAAVTVAAVQQFGKPKPKCQPY